MESAGYNREETSENDDETIVIGEFSIDKLMDGSLRIICNAKRKELFIKPQSGNCTIVCALTR